MPLEEHEVVPGAVAYFDHTVLLAAPDLDRNDDGLNRPGPFVCVQVHGDRSVWCAITTECRPERLSITSEFRLRGSLGWQRREQYLVDGLNTYLAPTSVFLRAAAAEKLFEPYLRPHVSPAGVQAILAEIDAQGGPLLPSGSDA